jgi:3-oxoacyl-[acyl-carrier protein] reductase
MTAATQERLLLFGASGAIGGAILSYALARGWQVTAVSRQKPRSIDAEIAWVETDPFDAAFSADILATHGPYTSVCWAQGANRNDSVYDVQFEDHLSVYKANCLYILITLRALLEGNLLRRASRLCIISSIWQNLARQSKLSYCMSKAALQGLVLSASADLAADGHLINAVLPGALDTPMTRQNLSEEQISRLSGATKFGALPQLDDVASLVSYLCSAENTGITGQFIASDLGYSHVRII